MFNLAKIMLAMPRIAHLYLQEA